MIPNEAHFGSMLLACWPRALRVTKAISNSRSGTSVSCFLFSVMEGSHHQHSHQPRQRHPQSAGNQGSQQQHHHHHYPSHQPHPYPSHNQKRPPHNHQYHGQPDYPQPPPPFPPMRSPSFLDPMALPSSDFHHGRPKSSARDRPSAPPRHLSSMWSHQPHSAPPPPLPQQEHTPNPQHPLTPHHLPWGFPPPDERWAMHPPPFPAPHHFPSLPPGPGLPLDPGLMQPDGRHGGKFSLPANYKAMDMFQQQSRNLSGPPGFSRGNWHKTHGSRGNQTLQQNGLGGQSYHGADKGSMEKSSERKRYKRPKTQSSPNRSPRCHAPLRPMVEVNKALKLKHTATLSVLSYNLLAQDLLEKNMHLYDRRHPDHLNWDFRKEGLLQELKQSSADILCLQEVQQEHYHDCFLPELTSLGYGGVFVQRTGSHLDGCALFYKQSKLRLVDWVGLKYRKSIKVLNRDNVALLARLELAQENGGDTSFCVANTHLLFNPKAGEVKLAQLTYLFAELHKLASNSGSEDTVPVLLCGDLNSTPHSPLINFITSSIIDYSDLSAIVIAGYFDNSKNSRTIPKPLLPPDMAIGPDCIYVAGGDQGRDLVRDDNTKQQSGVTSHSGAQVRDSAQVADRVKGQVESRQQTEPKITVVPDEGVVQTQSEFKEEKFDNQPSLRVTRSARGRRAPVVHSSRYNGVLDIPGVDSLLQANLNPPGTAVKRSRDQLSADDMKSSKSASSGASSVDDMLVETRSRAELDENTGTVSRQDCQSRSSSIMEESLNERQHHHDEAGSSNKYPKSLKSNATGSGGTADSASNNNSVVPTKNCSPKSNLAYSKLGQLTHPFKLAAAYPHPHPSQCRPSTVTTYHEAAFETVDYIFFSPMAYRMGSSGRKQLCGFHLLQRQVLPSTHTLLDLGPQPHKYLSSDHLLLKATFQFTW